MVRTVDPEGVHDGMKFLVITEGFCMIEGIVGPDTNHDTEAVFGLSRIGGIRDKSVVLKADLTGVGGRPGEKCLNARLEIWLQEPIDNSLTLSLHRLLRAFVRSEVTWNNASSGNPWTLPGLSPGVDYELTAEVTDTIGNLRGSPVITFNLDTWINDVCNGAADNFGFILNLDSAGTDSQSGYGEGIFDQMRPVFIIETAYLDTIQTDRDTMINATAQTSNYGTNPNVYIQSLGQRWIGLLDWDFSAIPTFAEIESATFYARSTGAWSTPNVLIAPILTAWVEGQVTYLISATGINWSVAGMQDGVDYDSSKGMTIASLVCGSGVWAPNDLTDVIKQYIPNKDLYHGLVFRPPTPGAGNLIFYQSEVSGGALNSYFEIVFRT